MEWRCRVSVVGCVSDKSDIAGNSHGQSIPSRIPLDGVSYDIIVVVVVTMVSDYQSTTGGES